MFKTILLCTTLLAPAAALAEGPLRDSASVQPQTSSAASAQGTHKASKRAKKTGTSRHQGRKGARRNAAGKRARAPKASRQ